MNQSINDEPLKLFFSDKDKAWYFREPRTGQQPLEAEELDTIIKNWTVLKA